jgi:hypothetical protein
MRFRRHPYEWPGIPTWSWPRVARELPALRKKPFLKALRKGGRPRCDDRPALGAILWRLRCGGPGASFRRGSAPPPRRAGAFRDEPYWRYDLDRVWRMEFAPLFDKKL